LGCLVEYSDGDRLLLVRETAASSRGASEALAVRNDVVPPRTKSGLGRFDPSGTGYRQTGNSNTTQLSLPQPLFLSTSLHSIRSTDRAGLIPIIVNNGSEKAHDSLDSRQDVIGGPQLMGRMISTDTEVSLLRHLADSISGHRVVKSGDGLIIHAIDVGSSIELLRFYLLPILKALL